MVETHIDISSVVGETAIDKDSITSQDESIVVTETDNGVDLSVVPTPLVTETADGLERKEDKELRDHSYTNIAMKGTFKSVDDAIKALQNIDSQYKPRHGQAIQFTDTDGEVHIFRYFGYYDIERSGSGREWVSCAYDEINEKWCILKYTKGGDLTVATSNSDASLWTIKEDILGSYERWFSLTSGDGKLVALTGNSSSEYAVSSDGGASWKLYSNIKTTYWKKVVYGMGKWWFLHETGLYTTTDFSTFENLSDRLSSITKLADMAVGQSCTYFLSSDKKLYSYNEETKTLSSGYSLSGGNKISQVVATDGADVLTISSSGGYVAGRTQVACVLKKTDSVWSTLRQTSSDTICGMMISQDLSCVVEIHHTKLVLANLNSKQTTEIALPESVSNFSNFAVNGNELLVVNGQHVEGDSGSGNYAFLIDMLTGKILNSEWSEIPILSSNMNTLLASNDGEFANVALDGYLTYDEESKTLSTENSDRYEDYANNRLTDGNNSLFVTNDLESITIGDAVYSDEQCTTQVGTVENVHHNPNNPNDVVVSESGISSVFRFIGEKINALATSRAVVELWNKVKDYLTEKLLEKSDKKAGELMKDGEENAIYNGKILVDFLSNGKEVDLCGKTFYVGVETRDHDVDKPTSIKDGGIIFNTLLRFIVKEGFSLNLSNVNFTCLLNNNDELFYAESLDFPISTFKVLNCSFDNVRYVARLTYTQSDIDPQNRRIGECEITGNYLKWNDGVSSIPFSFSHCQFTKCCNITNNTSIGCSYSTFVITSDYDNDTGADIVISNNYFDCGTYDSGNYHCAALVKHHKLIFKNNIVTRCISTSTNAYDICAYVKVLIYEGNDIRNLGVVENEAKDNYACFAYTKVLNTETESNEPQSVSILNNHISIDIEQIKKDGFDIKRFVSCGLEKETLNRAKCVVKNNTFLMRGVDFKMQHMAKEILIEDNIIETDSAIEYPPTPIINTQQNTTNGTSLIVRNNRLDCGNEDGRYPNVLVNSFSKATADSTIIVGNTIINGIGSVSGTNLDFKQRASLATLWYENQNRFINIKENLKLYTACWNQKSLNVESYHLVPFKSSFDIQSMFPTSTDFLRRFVIVSKNSWSEVQQNTILMPALLFKGGAYAFTIRIREIVMLNGKTNENVVLYLKSDGGDGKCYYSIDNTEYTEIDSYKNVYDDFGLKYYISSSVQISVYNQDGTKRDPFSRIIVELQCVEIKEIEQSTNA